MVSGLYVSTSQETFFYFFFFFFLLLLFGSITQCGPSSPYRTSSNRLFFSTTSVPSFRSCTSSCHHTHTHTVPPSGFGLPLGRLPWCWLARIWYTILLLSILLTWPTHLNLFILVNEAVSKSPYNYVSSLLCRLLQQLLISIANSIFLKTFRSKHLPPPVY
jgi:hypothetical protein